jgi:hypothetical protein
VTPEEDGEKMAAIEEKEWEEKVDKMGDEKEEQAATALQNLARRRQAKAEVVERRGDSSAPAAASAAATATAIAATAAAAPVFDNKTRFDNSSFPVSEGCGLGSTPTTSTSTSWRCRSCYATRYKTFCFGLNEATTTPTTMVATSNSASSEQESSGSSSSSSSSSSTQDNHNNDESATCVHCGKSRTEAGWSIWLPYDQLPNGWKRTAEKRHGPKIVSLLRTKWPKLTSVVTAKTVADTATATASAASASTAAAVQSLRTQLAAAEFEDLPAV